MLPHLERAKIPSPFEHAGFVREHPNQAKRVDPTQGQTIQDAPGVVGALRFQQRAWNTAS
jgi:hypothetical protein